MLRHLIWTFLYAFVIGLLYLSPGEDLPDLSFWSVLQADKLAHTVVFAGFTLVMTTGFKRQRNSMKLARRAMTLSFILGLGYGSVLEALQGEFAEGRVTEAADMVANAIGCAIGIVIYRFIYKE